MFSLTKMRDIAGSAERACSDGLALPSCAMEVDQPTPQESEVVDDVGDEAQMHRQAQTDDGHVYIYGVNHKGEHLQKEGGAGVPRARHGAEDDAGQGGGDGGRGDDAERGDGRSNEVRIVGVNRKQRARKEDERGGEDGRDDKGYEGEAADKRNDGRRLAGAHEVAHHRVGSRGEGVDGDEKGDVEAAGNVSHSQIALAEAFDGKEEDEVSGHGDEVLQHGEPGDAGR